MFCDQAGFRSRATANVLSRQDSGSKLHKKSASGSHEKLPQFRQTLRQCWIILGEFVEPAVLATCCRTVLI
jgi:hypothetical protein